MNLREKMVNAVLMSRQPRGNYWNREGAEAIVDKVVMPALKDMYFGGWQDAEEKQHWDDEEALERLAKVRNN